MNIDNLSLVYIPLKMGAVLAMIISWSHYKSVIMALVHGLFGWLYIVYYYLGKK